MSDWTGKTFLDNILNISGFEALAKGDVDSFEDFVDKSIGFSGHDKRIRHDFLKGSSNPKAKQSSQLDQLKQQQQQQFASGNIAQPRRRS